MVILKKYVLKLSKSDRKNLTLQNCNESKSENQRQIYLIKYSTVAWYCTIEDIKIVLWWNLYSSPYVKFFITQQKNTSLYSGRNQSMNKLSNKAKTLVPLKQVYLRAKKDKDFFSSLVKAPKTTLKSNALQLSPADEKKLGTLITKARAANRNSITLKAPPCDWGPI